MAFRVHCYHCKLRITPPYYEENKIPFCDKNCHDLAKKEEFIKPLYSKTENKKDEITHIRRDLTVTLLDTFKHSINKIEAKYIFDSEVTIEVDEVNSELKLIKNGQEIIFKIFSIGI